MDDIMRKAGVGCAAFLFLLTSLTSRAQQFPGVQYDRGQDVSPIFDGWERNPDGTFSMYFGYLNRNSRDEIDVPIGPSNTFNLEDGDQGQPTHFYSDGSRGRKWWVFKVALPKDWPSDKQLVWTLTNNGRTNQAKGSLKREYEVLQEGILLSDYRAEAQVEATAEGYKPAPRLLISVTGSLAQTVTLPGKARLTATAKVSDTSIKANGRGVRIQWLHYRGPGKVQFDPGVSPAAKGNITSETTVSFSLPGNYRIRALATDGQSFSTHDVEVKVN